MANSDPDRQAREQIAKAEEAKAAGININLWAGLVILAGGAIFLAWARLRPLKPEDLQGADTDRPNVE